MCYSIQSKVISYKFLREEAMIRIFVEDFVSCSVV